MALLFSHCAPRTTLAHARGHDRGILTQSKRREQMQPIGAEVLGCVGRDRTLYLLEVAQFKLSNCMLDEAGKLVQEALAIELRRYFVRVFDKPSSPVVEIQPLLAKLRGRLIITRQEFECYRRIGRLTDQCNAPAVERAIETVGCLVGLERGGAS